VATEKDYLTALLKDVTVVDPQQAAVVFAIITEGLVQPLRSRLEHITNTEKGVVVLYKIRHWTLFYIEKIRFVGFFFDFFRFFQRPFSSKSFRSTICNAEFFENSLLQLLTESLEAIRAQYMFALRSLASNIGKKLDVPQEDLQPSQSLSSVLSLLRELIASHEFKHGSPDDMTTLVSAVLEPLLQMCNESASHVSPNTPTVTAVYLLNCLHVVKCSLFPADHGGPCSDLLDRQVCDSFAHRMK
jgi:Conserved oligomeric complex COG6